jgi:hypothetical protein
MPKLPARAVAPLALTAAALVVGAACPRPGRRAPATPAEEACHFPGEEEARRQHAELDARCRAAVGRVTEKDAVAVALLRGDLGLAEAADRVRAIATADPAALARLRRWHAGASDEELWYRHVLDFARSAVTQRPDLDRARLARLEAELSAAFPAAGRRSRAARE